jgi:hypothetical protein
MTSRLPVLALCLLLPGWLHAQADPQDCPRLRASGASADLYCMPLIAAPGISAHGSVELGWVPGPFTVAVSPAGVQRWNLLISTSGLVPATTPPGKAGLVVWAVPPSLTPLLKLGVLRTGDMLAGPVAFDRFLLLISAESDTAQRGYELLRESGLTAEQAVQVVSFNGARILGVESKLGSVEKGKIADLVLLRGDLVADPSVIRNVVTVYKDGVAYDPSKLIDAVRGRVGVD